MNGYKLIVMVLKTAVVGAGQISEMHVSGLEQCPRTDPIAICDVDRDRAREAADEHGIKAYFDVDDLIAEEELDWVHLCTPVQTHLELGKKAIEADIPVMIEKPVTASIDEFNELESIAEENDVPVSVVNQAIFTPAMQKALDKINGGELGYIRGVDFLFTGATKPDEPNRGSWTFDLPGGEFEEGLPHPIYVTLSAGGYPRNNSQISSTTLLHDEYEQGFEYDSVQVQYASKDDVLCSIKMISGSIPQRLLHVHGDQQSLVVDLISQTLIELDEDYLSSPILMAKNNTDRLFRRLQGTVQNVYKFSKSRVDNSWETARDLTPHYYQIDEEAKALTENREMPVPLEQAKWTMEIMEDIRNTSTASQQVKHEIMN